MDHTNNEGIDFDKKIVPIYIYFNPRSQGLWIVVIALILLGFVFIALIFFRFILFWLFVVLY